MTAPKRASKKWLYLLIIPGILFFARDIISATGIGARPTWKEISATDRIAGPTERIFGKDIRLPVLTGHKWRTEPMLGDFAIAVTYVGWGGKLFTVSFLNAEKLNPEVDFLGEHRQAYKAIFEDAELLRGSIAEGLEVLGPAITEDQKTQKIADELKKGKAKVVLTGPATTFKDNDRALLFRFEADFHLHSKAERITACTGIVKVRDLLVNVNAYNPASVDKELVLGFFDRLLELNPESEASDPLDARQ